MPNAFFSAPKQGLDPDLFAGDQMKEEVREGLLHLLYDDLESDVGLKEPENWVVAWLAGSGASYQWSASRSGNDLDVLFGVDFPGFLIDNPQFPRLSEAEVATYVDKILRARSWPKTRNVTIGASKKHYEITFFWNPGMGTDIRNIHPYAAYDLLMNRWDVKPPDIPVNPHTLYPSQWYDFAERDYEQAILIEEMATTGGNLGRHTAGRAASSMWRDIHGGRKYAFSDMGLGYGDFHNFRWQRGKEKGTIDILRRLLPDDEPVDTPGDLITRAAMRYASPRYA